MSGHGSDSRARWLKAGAAGERKRLGDAFFNIAVEFLGNFDKLGGVCFIVRLWHFSSFARKCEKSAVARVVRRRPFEFSEIGENELPGIFVGLAEGVEGEIDGLFQAYLIERPKKISLDIKSFFNRFIAKSVQEDKFENQIVLLDGFSAKLSC